MRASEPKAKLASPWRSLHAAIWLLGLALLAWQDWWWPGILVLVALSLVIEALLPRFMPPAFQPAAPPAEAAPVTAPPTATLTTAPAPEAAEHPVERLPAVCPRCGAPVRGPEVKWTSWRSPECPYCGLNLPLTRGDSPAGP